MLTTLPLALQLRQHARPYGYPGVVAQRSTSVTLPVLLHSCPAGQRLIWRFARVERGMLLHRYWSSSCGQCALKAKCTPGTERRVTRWEHEDVLDAMQTRLDLAPDSMRIRRQTVERPYGTIKLWMGPAHFLMRTLTHVGTEMSLHVLAYNLKRVIKILGIKGLVEAIRELEVSRTNQTSRNLATLEAFFKMHRCQTKHYYSHL